MPAVTLGHRPIGGQGGPLGAESESGIFIYHFQPITPIFIYDSDSAALLDLLAADAAEQTQSNRRKS